MSRESQGPVSAAQLATALRDARVAKGLGLEEAARRAMLSEDQAAGLESGDHHTFYSPDYARRAARRYAESLGLGDLAANLQIAATAPAPQPGVATAAPPARQEAIPERLAVPVTSRRTPPASVLLVGGAVLIAAVAWLVRPGQAPEVPASPPAVSESGPAPAVSAGGVAEPADAIAPAALPVGGQDAAGAAPLVDAALTVPAENAEPATAPADQPATAAGQAATASSELPATVGTTQSELSGSAGPPAVTAPADVPAASQAAPPEQSPPRRSPRRFYVLAIRGTPLRVRDATGRTLHDGAVGPGFSRSFEGEPPFSVEADSPDPLEVYYLGRRVRLQEAGAERASARFGEPPTPAR